MNTSILFVYIISVVTFLILPGPVNLFVVNSTIRYGLRGVVWAIIGTNFASLILIGIAGMLISGIGSLNANIMNGLTLLGASYMIYYGGSLGCSLFNRRMNNREISTVDTAELIDIENELMSANIKDDKHYRLTLCGQGLIIGISNPKDIIFFMAFFPPFLQTLGLALIPSLILLALVWTILDYSILLMYGMGAHYLLSPRFEKIMSGMCALIFIGIGVAVYGRLLMD